MSAKETEGREKPEGLQGKLLALRSSLHPIRKAAGTRLRSIRTTINITFTVIFVAIMLIIGLTLYGRFVRVARQNAIEATQKTLSQSSQTLEQYLNGMRHVSDAAYYSSIRENDIGSRRLLEELSLLYEADKESIVTIAVYSSSGSLLAAEPVANQKMEPDVTRQEWFQAAIEGIENPHFSLPHVQNLFDADSYRRVISLSRSVDLNTGDEPETGVLLLDFSSSDIEQMMQQLSGPLEGQYYYLCDSDGNLIAHPQKAQIMEGLLSEDTSDAAKHPDGILEQTVNGTKRTLIIHSISYTGWKMVSVIPNSSFRLGMLNVRLFIEILLLMAGMIVLAVNRVVAGRISRPIMELNDSVKAYEAGGAPRIEPGGSMEIQHLGRSIQTSYERIDRLMQQIVNEQNLRRISEIDALQSQINPHFLYNTLDSITWMIEGGKNDEAVFMISELAKLFRISLSKGRTIIPVRDEIQHARSYMNIQKARYKDRFLVDFNLPEDIMDCCTVKLILQPLLENAIYYGVGDMDVDDGGKIIVSGGTEENGIYLRVEDNGFGMPEETAEAVLTKEERVHKHGSGVGLVNVHNRIRLLMGEQYGLSVESEEDKGTKITVHLPKIPYTEENRKKLEGKGDVN